MSGKYLLDTSVVIKLLNGEDKVIAWFNRAERVFISLIVIGELYYGAYKSNQKKKNLEKLDEFISSISFIETDPDTGKFYGLIKNMLRKKGRPIPDNDIWIAAIAVQNKLSIVTDDKHFSYIDNITVKFL